MKVITSVSALKRGHKKEITSMKQSFKHTWLLGLLILPMVFFKAPDIDNPVEVQASYAPYQIPNGGFESGNLNGWRAYSLWKGETGMAAFDSSLVTNGTYFGSNPYNRDGNYNLGITSATVTWNQAEERMGYLRSSDFVLGGSGWISFKLGGGRLASFAYMSVRRVSDNKEVARFGNRWFNNTTRATAVYGSSISNAEAFMFPYYFDLSTVTSLGTSLYITLCDTSSYNWSILSADSFVTYYASAPTPDADSTAVNIVPSILGISTAANSIVDGYFDSGFTYWQNVDSTWKISSGQARSNNTGDSDIGVIRSSAFTVSTNKYIRFSWAGGLKNDKQIFISIMEAESHIEMIRFVRRDNLSSKESESFDNHMLNLSSLDASKKYYIECSDNITSGWGISYVDEWRIVPESEWNSVTSGDRAVIISGVPTSFTPNYVQEAASYGAYFLEQTNSLCAALNGGSADWTTLGTEYGTLSASAKDYFVAGGTTETSIVAARERYQFMITKYTAFQSNNFMVSSTGTKYVPAYANNIFNSTNDTTNSLFLIALVAISGLSVLAYMIIRKKKVA